jgi:hypothetical protein
MAGLKYLKDDLILTIRYECLVLEFESTVSHILEFIGEESVAELGNWHEYTSVTWQESWPGRAVRPLYASSIERWRRPEFAHRVETFLAEPNAQRCLIELGYEIGPTLNQARASRQSIPQPTSQELA